MIPGSFDYIAPRTVQEALRALADNGDEAKLLAGGHSLLPLMKLRLANPKLVIDIRKIPGLNEIRQEKDRLVIGTMVTHYQIESLPLLKKSCPVLCETARAIGDVQVRNRGTIGGSLAHADPAADWPAAMLALGAELKILGPKGERVLPTEDFFLGPMTTALESVEILTEIHVPVAPRRSGAVYLKLPQQASGFAIVGVAASVRLNTKNVCEEIGIGITGLSEKPFRARAVEEPLRGKKLTAKLIESAAARITAVIDVLEDLHAAADYRIHLARIYTQRAVQEAAKRAAGTKPRP